MMLSPGISMAPRAPGPSRGSAWYRSAAVILRTSVQPLRRALSSIPGRADSCSSVHDEGSGPLHGDARPAGVVMQQAAAPAKQPALQAARHRVEACVQDRGVRLGGPGADITRRVHQHAAQLIAGDRAGDRGADHPGTDDDDIRDAVARHPAAAAVAWRRESNCWRRSAAWSLVIAGSAVASTSTGHTA